MVVVVVAGTVVVVVAGAGAGARVVVVAGAGARVGAGAGATVVVVSPAAATMAKPTVSELSGNTWRSVTPHGQVRAFEAQMSPSASLETLVIRTPTGFGYSPLVCNDVVIGAPGSTSSVRL